MNYIDTHCHLDGEEFNADREAVMQRAREAGVGKIFLPAIDLPSSQRILSLCLQHPGFLYPMVGLHPEEVRADWREQLAAIKELIISLTTHLSPIESSPSARWASTSIGAVSLSRSNWMPLKNRCAGLSSSSCP